MANSLDYLSSQFGVQLKLNGMNLKNIYGANLPTAKKNPNPVPPDSLEAQIDVRMGRANDSGIKWQPIILGKLQFLIDMR